MKKIIYILWILFLIIAFYLFGVKQGEKFYTEKSSADSLQHTESGLITITPESQEPMVMLPDSTAVEDTGEQRAEINNAIMAQRGTLITRCVSEVENAVVGINVIQLKRYVQRTPFGFNDPFWQMFAPELFRDRNVFQKVQSLGSGFIISADGYVVTNEHVVEDAAEIVVTTTDGSKHQAQVIGTDKVSDIALLKIDTKNAPHLRFGNSDKSMIGEWVIALGNPFGLFDLNDKPTVTVGVISALDRDWGKMDQTGRVYQDMIQTDAAINHGNSGGPLVNVLGECIGMNTFIYTGNSGNQGFVGIGFAIPSNKINEIIEMLKTEGQVQRDYWTGIEIQQIDDLTAQALGLKKAGVLVTHIEKDSPAEKAGLKRDDIIIAIQDKPVTSFKDARHILMNLGLKVGDNLEISFWRDGKEDKAVLVLEANKESK